MILNVDQGINRYYVQTLCMVFFPGAKFSLDEEATPDTPVITVHTSTDGENVTASVTVSVGEISVTAEDTRPKRTAVKINAEKVAIGAAFLKAGKLMFNYSPAWGILTGVRPSKLAMDLMTKDKLSMREIRQILTKQYFLNPKKASLVMSVAEREMGILDGFDRANTCSVYISIPFCPSRCNYCSFVSYSTPRLLSLIPDYIDMLCRDIDETFRVIKNTGKRVTCVYVGGGTPSILEPEQIARILDRINAHIRPRDLTEYSFEAGRPDTITREKMKVLKQHGVGRISVNPQTLNDVVLETIGRGHTAADFYRAYDIARKSGIECINTDLIVGLPGESFASLARTVDAILQLSPENITFHTFCVKRAADIVKSDRLVYSRQSGPVGKCVDYAQLKAKLAGYEPYYMYRQKNTVGNFENVGYERDGHDGFYNIFMMEEIHSIFAVGAGGVTKLVNDDGTYIKRVSAPKYPYEYLDPAIHERSIRDILGAAEKFFDAEPGKNG